MSERWPRVRLGEVLRRSTNTAEILPDTEYQEITVKLWGKGVVQRGTVAGAEIAGSRRFVARRGQFILSRIDARNGALGIVPPELCGAVVTNDFPLFDPDAERLDSSFLGWLSQTHGFVELCLRASEGTTNRVRLKEERFLALELPLPPLAEQRRIVGRIEELAAKVTEVKSLRSEHHEEQRSLLVSAFRQITEAAPRRPLSDVAPLVRRPVQIQIDEEYPELGIRSFGRGTFHKPPLPGSEVGSKRLFEIHPGDLVFSNVFAWEGAVAVARDADSGRVGSHRFITCVPKPGVATSPFLWFYFLTEEGLEELGKASPGGAGRNRTLGLTALSTIEVPIVEYERQRWFDSLQAQVEAVERIQSRSATELDALLPAVLDRAFKGEL